MKDVPVDEVARAIRSVANGDAVVSPRITRRLLDVYATRLPDASGGAAGSGGAALDLLRPREQDVLLAVLLSDTEIAERLVVSEATVETHVGSILAEAGPAQAGPCGHLRLRRGVGPVSRAGGAVAGALHGARLGGFEGKRF